MSDSGSESSSRPSSPPVPKVEYHFRPAAWIIAWLRSTWNFEEDVDGVIIDPNVLITISPETTASSGTFSSIPTESDSTSGELRWIEIDHYFLDLGCAMPLPGADDDGVRSTASSDDGKEELTQIDDPVTNAIEKPQSDSEMYLFRTFSPRTLLSLSVPALFSTMASPSPPATYPSFHYAPRHTSFPYTARDFLRQDESPDTNFYSSPRFVTHIDDNAIALLREYYAHNLPKIGRVLDFCSSWISHFPQDLEERAVKTAKGQLGDGQERLEIVGMGINQKELAANPILKERILQDLNTKPEIPATVGELDAATCVVSIDYLIEPRGVLESLRSRTRNGGIVHLIISNRCFPTKAVGRWLRVGEQEKLLMVGDYLHFSGWKEIEVVTLCDGKGDGGGWFGLGRPDPLWVVRGKKLDG